LLAVKQETEKGVEFFLWNVTDQTTVLQPVLRGPTRHDTEAIDFSSDDRWFTVDAPDGSIVIYDLTTGKEARRLPAWLPGSPPRFVRFDPRGEKLAVSCHDSDTVQIWDVKAKKVIREFPHPHVAAETAWSPDGQWLAVACLDPDDRVHVWDVESGTRLAALEGHKAGVWAVAFHPHADLLVSYGWDKTRLWDFRGGRELLAVDGWFLRFSRDGRHLAFRNGRQVGLWEVTTAEECRPLYGHDRMAAAFSSAFNSNGRLLATCAADGVRLWDVVASRQVAALTELGVTDCVAFDPVSGGLFTCSRAGLQLWQVRITGGETAAHYQIGSPELIRLDTDGAPRGLSLSQDGDVLAVDLESWQAVVIHRREGKRPIVLNAHNSQAGVAVSPDGRWVATGNYKGSGAHVWDSRTGERKCEFPCGGTVMLAFSPDNQWLILSEAGEARFYRVGTWELRPPAEWPSGLGHCLAFTRDAQVMAVNPLSSGVVRLVQAGTGQELATLEITPRPSLITGRPTFSPDGSQLVVHYGHEGQRVWDLRKIRARLAAMGLDWDRPAYPPAAESSPEPLRVVVSSRPLAPFTWQALTAWSLQKLRAQLGPAAGPGPTSGREHRENSREHLNARRWQQAFDEANKAVTRSESDAEGWVLRGRARYELRQTRPALADFNRALALAPGNPEASHYRGHCHENLGEYPEAVADFTAALRRVPGDPHLHARRGLNQLRLGQFDEAIADLRTVLASRPATADEIVASRALAWVLATGPESVRDPAQALPLAERAIELARESFDPVNTLGVVYYRLGQYEKAREALKRAAALHKQDPTAENRFFLAMSHHRLGETAAARACYDQGVAQLKARPAAAGHPREQLDALRAEADALLNSR
jgi:WD40 repeat protein/tetratricopeptide (TPR) repeat protein